MRSLQMYSFAIFATRNRGKLWFGSCNVLSESNPIYLFLSNSSTIENCDDGFHVNPPTRQRLKHCWLPY